MCENGAFLARKKSSLTALHDVGSQYFFAHVDPGRVFQGTHVDDIASAIFCMPVPRRVLILGASLAAVTLPLSVFTSIEQIVLVDIDPPTPVILTSMRAEIDIVSVQCDALDYLRSGEDQFDLIYADIYTTSAYANLLFKHDFYRAMGARLHLGGRLVVNAFDIPCYLRPTVGNTVTTTIAEHMGAVFRDVRILGNRRNTLLIGTMAPFIVHDHVTRALDELDRARLHIARLRTADFRRSNRMTYAWTAASFLDIDMVMHVRMQAMLETLSSQYGLAGWQTFRQLALEAPLSVRDLGRALHQSAALRSILRTELAAHAFADPEFSNRRLHELGLHTTTLHADEYTNQALVDMHAIAVCGAQNALP